MQIFTGLDTVPRPLTRPYITLGNFDGVHLGHQLLFSEVVNKAYNNKGTAVAVTFDPHPLKVVRPEPGIKMISTFEQKVELIELANIDVLIVIPFTREFAATPAAAFIDQLLATTGITELVVGYDYAFGRGREGDIAFLQEQGRRKGFAVSVVEPLYVDGKLVSSTKIRQLITEGKMGTVRKLLGRFYQIRGTVEAGRGEGGEVIGFPTANISLSEEDLCPRLGVYVVQVIYGGKCYGGVMNIGYNPTFGGEILTAETHIFDFDEDIYGKRIKINLLRFLRGEKRFSGPRELAAQIARDIEQAREILAAAQKELLLACEEKYNR